MINVIHMVISLEVDLMSKVILNSTPPLLISTPKLFNPWLFLSGGNLIHFQYFSRRGPQRVCMHSRVGSLIIHFKIKLLCYDNWFK